MPQTADVQTEVQDLSAMKLADLQHQDPARFSGTLRRLLSRVEQPSRSISGYNPQRLD
ncbi:hypothetical protein Acsp01_77980 [Actinoplanes sp. NBRC 101535]|nr:hypothetical protein Acsp01_77980 [Actinoplanes sp. NBRC 101535]